MNDDDVWDRVSGTPGGRLVPGHEMMGRTFNPMEVELRIARANVTGLEARVDYLERALAQEQANSRDAGVERRLKRNLGQDLETLEHLVRDAVRDGLGAEALREGWSEYLRGKLSA